MKELEDLRKLVDYENRDYIQILYGNAWEVQFYQNGKLVACETNKSDLKKAITAILTYLRK